jgi:DNA polymerase
MNAKALRAVKYKRRFDSKFISFNYENGAMTILLPSGRKLYYQNPKVMVNRFGKEAIKFQGVDEYGWNYIETYGGKLTENIVQAISRDILADSMRRLKEAKKNMTMHVHDEVVAEVKKENAYAEMEEMCRIMGEDISWAPGLPLSAAGFITEFYIKD